MEQAKCKSGITISMEEAFRLYGSHPLAQDMIRRLYMYVDEKVHPGALLYSMLCDKLVDSMITANGTERMVLPNVIDFIVNYLPSDSRGSNELVGKWLGQKAAEVKKEIEEDVDEDATPENENKIQEGESEVDVIDPRLHQFPQRTIEDTDGRIKTDI